MTTAPKLEEPRATGLSESEKDDMRKFMVFLSILAIVGAIVAIIRKNS